MTLRLARYASRLMVEALAAVGDRAVSLLIALNSDAAAALKRYETLSEVFVMMKMAVGTGLAMAALVALSLPAAQAADAAHPYSNVDHSVDAGNNTGDSQVDQLNQQQLQKNATGSQGGSGQGWSGNTGGGSVGSSGQPGYRAAYGAPPYYTYAPYPYPVYAYAPYPWRPWWRRRVWVGPGYYWR